MKRNVRFLAVCLLTAIIAVGCLLPTALGDTKVTMGKKIKMKDGIAKISWTAEGDEPLFYYVDYKLIGHGDAKQGRHTATLTTSKSAELDVLIPGCKYTIYVCDPAGKTLAKKTYTIPKAKKFKDGSLKDTSIKISVEFRKQVGSDQFKKLKTLKASDIVKALKDDEDIYGLKYEMKQPVMSQTRDVHVMLAFEAPNGFAFADTTFDKTFVKDSSHYSVLTIKLAGRKFFRKLYEANNTIPAGKYTATLYWNGMVVNTYKFNVK